jgi:Protein of unknown function (DUF1018)
MTPKQEYLRKGLLAKIHMSLPVKMMKQDGDWKEWLTQRYGVDTCAKLSIDELENVIGVLTRGEEVKVGKRGRPRDETKASDNQIATIEAQWRELARNKSDAALREFIYITTKLRPLHLETLAKSDATKVINGIKRL